MGHGARYLLYVERLQGKKEQIKKLRGEGMRLRDILVQIGVPPHAYYQIIREYPEIEDANIQGTKIFCTRLLDELTKLALPHTITTKKTYIKKDIETGNKTEYVEKTEKECLGEIGAIHLLLKNNSPYWTDNPAEYRLKLRQFEWEKKKDCEKWGLVDPEAPSSDEEG